MENATLYDLKTRQPIRQNKQPTSADNPSADIFDSLIHLEDKFTREAVEQGIEHGKKIGVEEGFDLGFRKGDEIGTEVGYYDGNTRIWLALSAQVPSLFPPRALKSLNQLQQLISTYSTEMDPKNEELLEVLENIRAKYNMLCSQIGVSFKQNDSLNF